MLMKAFFYNAYVSKNLKNLKNHISEERPTFSFPMPVKIF